MKTGPCATPRRHAPHRAAPRLLALVLLLLAACAARTQQPSPWDGEWGTFTDPLHNQRLTITACSGDTCTFELNVRDGSYCGTTGKPTLTLTSPVDATATLPGAESGQSCKLQIHRDPAAIAITAAGDACASYYCTAGAASFNRTFPLRAPAAYVGVHEDECLANTSPARMATCTDPALADQEQHWLFLYDAFPLDTAIQKPESNYTYAQKLDAALLDHCDTVPSPAQCLRDRYTADIATMSAAQQAYIASYTYRGDPGEAATLVKKIAGSYRHNFANSDVSGDHFRSTDTLTITPVGQASIHFDLHLEFYNGHQCELSGGALYRKDGSFVFDADPSTAVKPWPVCHLAITPTATGIVLQDLLGTDLSSGCKMISCGMRGGYNGAGFTYAERVSPKKKPAVK